MFVFSFLFIGASVVRAEVPVLSSNLVKLSKDSRVNAIRLKIAAIMKVKCNARTGNCEMLLAILLDKNRLYAGCLIKYGEYEPCADREIALIDAGNAYNTCMSPIEYPPQA